MIDLVMITKKIRLIIECCCRKMIKTSTKQLIFLKVIKVIQLIKELIHTLLNLNYKLPFLKKTKQ